VKIQLASDLHYEFYGGSIPDEKAWHVVTQTDADVLVLAGDIISLRVPLLFEYLRVYAASYPHVIYLPGNHEYWGQPVSTSESALRALDAEIPNLHVLSHATAYEVVVDGQRFVGDTMWVPDTPDARIYRTNDPNYISGFMPWAFDLHERFKRHLYQANVTSDDVVLTHYLPSYQSIHPRYKGLRSNAWFVGDIEAFLVETQPKLLLHGHTHAAVNFKLGETRVICNPAGYPGEKFEGYQKNLVVTV
jgi:predicted phosphodiesterase